jgi:hypothetical protein
MDGLDYLFHNCGQLLGGPFAIKIVIGLRFPHGGAFLGMKKMS